MFSDDGKTKLLAPEKDPLLPIIQDEISTEKKEETKKEVVKEEFINNEDYYSSANCISRLFYYWGFRIIQAAQNHKITLRSLGVLKGMNSSINFSKTTNYVYHTLNYKAKKCSLLLTIMKSNLSLLIMSITLSVTLTGGNVGAMNLFRYYIRLFSQLETQKEKVKFLDFVLIGGGYLAIKFANMFIGKFVGEFQMFLGFKSGTELNILIFDKILKSSPASTKGKAESGQILNYVQVDSMRLTRMMLMSPFAITIPIMLIAYSYMLFDFLGWSFIFGMTSMVFFLVLNFCLQRILKRIIFNRQRRVDRRLRITTETLFNLKVLKLYAWDNFFLQQIINAREDDIKQLSNLFQLDNFNKTLLWFAPVFTATVTIACYFSFVPNVKIEDIFTCIGILGSIQEPIRSIAMIYTNIIETMISLNRIQKFLGQDEINENNIIHNDPETLKEDIAIQITNGNFSWGAKKKADEDLKVKNEAEALNTLPLALKDINLTVKKGEFLCIIGEVGSGKTTLLNAILNNMLQIETEEAKPRVIVNGTIAYVSQSAWIQNATVRNNILFHQEFNREKYDKIIQLSELKQDLEILHGGDQTEIGEKGINLSGGQKARITIARALYAERDLYLFDDPISALDANVGKNIINNVLCDHLKGKTRILVTHAVQYCKKADRIVYIKDGQIIWDGPYRALRKENFYKVLVLQKRSKSKGSGEISAESISMEEEVNDDFEENPEKEEKEKKSEEVKRITREEDREQGRLKGNPYVVYLRNIGGCFMITMLFISLVIWQVMKCSSDLWLAEWSTKEQKKEDTNRKFDTKSFAIYAGLGLGSSLFTYIRLVLISTGAIKNSRRLHNNMVTALIHAPINLYHDTVPKGQILNRLSKDLDIVDFFSNLMFNNAVSYAFNLLGQITICAIFQVYCLSIVPPIFILAFFVMRYYLNCSRELSRVDGIARSPMINCINETIYGADTIRAFQMQDNFTETFKLRIDEFLKARIYLAGTSQWFSLMLDFLSFSFICFLIVFTFCFRDEFSAGVIGIILNYCTQLPDEVNRFLLCRSNLENDMVGLERCLSYTRIEGEKAFLGNEPADTTNWPSQGKIEVKDYSVKYRPDTEIVLKHVTFEVQGGEKIGIVGRTGSGKSTIALCLFRLLEALEGSIEIDGIDIKSIPLSTLRSSITIIPQDPSLMEGSLRFNIDPLGVYTDQEIEEIMRNIGFWYICERSIEEAKLKDPENKGKIPVGLDMIIAEGGTNISIGEKQLICITRAILRRSKIIVMDEATASIDVKTENIIQKAINELLNQSTILTIAHRIKTIINSDKILVLDNGEVVEFDEPKVLLANKESIFYELYTKSNV